MKTHIALDVVDLDLSVEFFRNLIGADLVILDQKERTACVEYANQEFSLFERSGFNGYSPQLFGSLHFGFELETREAVDEAYQRAVQLNYRLKTEPFERSDGDYAFFVFDPNGMLFEFLWGQHLSAKERSDHECRS